MARRKDKIPSERVRIDGNRKRGIDTRQDKTFAWLDAAPDGERFGFVWDLITAALNGELGSMMQEAVEVGDIELARKAAAEIIGAFVVDDDDAPPPAPPQISEELGVFGEGSQNGNC